VKIYEIFAGIDMTDIVKEFTAQAAETSICGTEVYCQILFAPYRRINLDEIDATHAWYEKFCLLMVFNLCFQLDEARVKYKWDKISIPFPSRSTAMGMSSDQEFCLQWCHLGHF
jgi:hypothetical protein